MPCRHRWKRKRDVHSTITRERASRIIIIELPPGQFLFSTFYLMAEASVSVQFSCWLSNCNNNNGKRRWQSTEPAAEMNHVWCPCRASPRRRHPSLCEGRRERQQRNSEKSVRWIICSKERNWNENTVPAHGGSSSKLQTTRRQFANIVQSLKKK